VSGKYCYSRSSAGSRCAALSYNSSSGMCDIVPWVMLSVKISNGRIVLMYETKPLSQSVPRGY